MDTGFLIRLTRGDELWAGPWPHSQISAPAIVRTNGDEVAFALETELTGVVGYPRGDVLEWLRIESTPGASGIGVALMPVIEERRLGLFYVGSKFHIRNDLCVISVEFADERHGKLNAIITRRIKTKHMPWRKNMKTLNWRHGWMMVVALLAVPVLTGAEANGCSSSEGGSGGGSDGCVVGGCSSQLCVESGNDGISTCEWREEYACYKDHGICERNASDQCGWRATQELQDCIAAANNN